MATPLIVKLPDDEEISYTDSGALQTDDYTTLIVQHGCGFNAASFEHLNQLALSRNIRIVLLTRRDYRGSMLLNEFELDDLRQGKKAYLDRFALQNARFMEHLIKVGNIPKPTVDRKGGGIILVGWSLGNAFTISTLSDPDVLPKGLYEFVEPFLRTVVLYEIPDVALAYTPPAHEGLYLPFIDPDNNTPEKIIDGFYHWTSSYYDHSDFSGNIASMDFRKRTEKSTVKNWTREEVEKRFETAPILRSDIPAIGILKEHIAQQRENALFDEGLAKSFFPNVDIFCLSGDKAVWFSVWTFLEHKRRYDDLISQGKEVRRHKFALVEGANHFIHYDHPEIFLDQILQGISRN